MNRSMSKNVLGLMGLLPLVGLTGCVVHDRRPREVIVEERPPETRYEVRSVAPSREHVWIDGHYVRVGNHWDWIGGHWEHRPRHEAVWLPGRYEPRGHGYVWIEGSWR